MKQLQPRFHKKLCQCKCRLHGTTTSTVSHKALPMLMRLHRTTTSMVSQKSFAYVNAAYMEQLQPQFHKNALPM
jgi:hypothetical protein